ncbi:MAG: cadmium-translocating P-type ATPase [Oscillospiraceae bacterium]|nr:cadmium-translocating P-type ATPase [Oscillospiraceae bacterium]
MAKHLAKKEKKRSALDVAKEKLSLIKDSAKKIGSREKSGEKKSKGPEKTIARAIRIPVTNSAKKAAARKKETEGSDAFQSVMLNKTLDLRFNTTDLFLTALALILLVIAHFLPTSGPIRLLSFLVPFLLAGYNYLYEAFQEAFMGIVLGRELILMIAVLMALCAGEYLGAAAVMICLKIGDLTLAYIEMIQSEKVSALYALRPEKAELVNGDAVSPVRASEIAVGSEILVRAGETIPVDGVVLDGTSVLDAAPLVGGNCSFPVAVGSEAISGCTNVNAPLRIRVERTQKDSVSSALIRAAENAWMHKSAHERQLQWVLSYLSPALVLLSVLMAVIPSIATGEWRVYLVRAAILLTVSQMYSVVQSVKLSYDCAAACAASDGVVVKGHDVLESLSRAETMVFDKTGTVTEGEYRVKEVFPRGVSEGQLLFLAGAAELYSPHPIAKAIVAASGAYASEISAVDIKEIPGRGVSAFIDGRCVYVGNAAMMEEHGIAFDNPSIPGSAIHVGVDGHYLGHIILEDALRDSAFDVIEELRAAGVGTSVLLTGDVHSSARRIASSLNFDLVKAELTPEEKCSSVEYLMSNRNVNTTLAFVGDGVCDADALRLATVGIALGSFDKPEALEASDAAILGRELRTLPRLYRLAVQTARTALQQTIVCGAVKLLVLIFGAAGLCSLPVAAVIQMASILYEAYSARRILLSGDEHKILRVKERKI